MLREQWIYANKNTFSSGELTPTIEGRNDLSIYQHGVKKLINFMILPSGGLTRRHGTEYVHLFDESDTGLCKCMMTLSYSRDCTFLIVFVKVDQKSTRVKIFINGKGKPINLKPEKITLDREKFSFAVHQGVAYISFGTKTSIWKFFIDHTKFLDLESLTNQENLNHDKIKSIFIFKKFVDDKITQEQDAQKLLRANKINIFDNRLWIFGTGTNIHEIAASNLVEIERFDIEKNDSDQINNPLSSFFTVFQSSTFDDIVWSIACSKELLLGTTDGIYVLNTNGKAENNFYSIHKDIDISVSMIPPIICGKTVFFVEGGDRKIHSLYFSQEKGGYQVSCITTYSDHLFSSGIRQILSVESPFNLIFAIMNNGSFATFSYSQDLKIMGWSQHWLGGNGKAVEALPLLGVDSNTIYFRAIRVDNILEKGEVISKNKEYLESFNCKYLNGNIDGVHNPVYADCYKHYGNHYDEKIDQKFVQALNSTNSFERKDDASYLENTLIENSGLEYKFKDEDILKNFTIGGSNLSELRNIVEKSNFEPTVTDNLQSIYIDFIKKYFSQYLRKVQILLGLEMAIFRKLQLFNSHVTNIILGQHEQMRHLEPLRIESLHIAMEIRKYRTSVTRIEIHQYLKDKQYDLVSHKEKSKYSFYLSGILQISQENRDLAFEDIVKQMSKVQQTVKYYCSSPEYFIRFHKEKILKDFNFKSNYSLLKSHVSINVENLNIEEFIEKSNQGRARYLENIGEFQEQSNDFLISNYILDNLSLEEEFVEYFAIEEDTLLKRSGILTVKTKEIEDFFEDRIRYIASRIHGLYNQRFIKNELLRALIKEAFLNFLNLLGIIKKTQREEVRNKMPELVDKFFQKLSQKESKEKNLIRNQEDELSIHVSQEDKCIHESIQVLEEASDINFLIDREDSCVTKNFLYLCGLTLLPSLKNKPELECMILNHPIKVKKALRIKWYDLQNNELDNVLEKSNLDKAEKSLNLISFERLAIIGYLLDCQNVNIDESLINDLENDCSLAKKDYQSLKKCKNKYLILLMAITLRSKNLFTTLLHSFVEISNYVSTWDKEALLHIATEISHPTKIDKYLLLSQKYFPIFKQNFPDIDTEMIKMLARHSNARINQVESKELQEIYGSLNIGFIGDNELLLSQRMFGNKLGIITLPKYVSFLSFGFPYSSVLQTFPLIFHDEYEHINKKDTAVGIKFFNTSGGFIEERSFSGITKKQFVNCPKINLDNIKYFASDEKYLIGDAVRNIKTPYISGWIDFNLNHPASKDIDLVYIVDRPDPATILKIYVKTKLLTNYLN